MVGQVLLPARILTNTTACRVRIDAVGIGHAVLTTQYELRFYEVNQVQKWKGRWSQPRGQNLFALDTKWKWGGVQDIRSITPQLIRRVLTAKKTEETGVKRTVERLRTRPEIGGDMASEVTIHTPRDTVALPAVVCSEEPGSGRHQMQSARMQRGRESDTPV